MPWLVKTQKARRHDIKALLMEKIYNFDICDITIVILKTNTVLMPVPKNKDLLHVFIDTL